MEYLKEDRFLKFRSDTLEVVRKDVNLGTKDRMKEAVDILENWVRLQPHFVKKDFSRGYLERTLIIAKGLVERAKERMDKLCTFKTLMSEFFTVYDVKNEFAPIQKVLTTAHMPRLTPEHYRVYLCKIISENDINQSILFSIYRYLIALSEYLKRVEYCSGFVIILDYSDTNLFTLVTKLNPIELRQIVTLMTEGYGIRIKSIHVITPSKAVDIIVALLKQIFSSKLANRIYTHKSVEGIYDFVPKDILPVDYGGEEKPLKELHSEWLDIIGNSEFLEYFSSMNQASTIESCRSRDTFNENYIGMPGSFRALSVD